MKNNHFTKVFFLKELQKPAPPPQRSLRMILPTSLRSIPQDIRREVLDPGEWIFHKEFVRERSSYSSKKAP